MKTIEINPYPSFHQRGAVLIISLLMLLVTTLIGVTAMQTNLLEEKMAGNFRDFNLAFQAAEATLRDAETDIATSGRISGLTGFNAACANGLCDATNGLSQVWNTQPNNGVTLGTYTVTATLPLVAQQPQYWIEGYLAQPAGVAPPGIVQYRITTLGYGGNAATRVVLQSVYAP